MPNASTKRNNLSNVLKIPSIYGKQSTRKLKMESKNSSIDNLVDNNNVEMKDKDEIAQYVNDYSCSVGWKLLNKINTNFNDRLELFKMNKKTIFLDSTHEVKLLE